jgi:hypothetical protein
MYTHPLLHSTKTCCLATSAVTLQGPEVKWLPFCTLMSSRITSRYLPVVLLVARERNKTECKKSRRERISDRTSLAVLYSTRWGRLRCRFLGADTPRAELPRPLSMAPPRVGSTCVYPSLSTLSVKLDRLPGRPGCGITEAFIDSWPILRWRCPSIL